MKKFSSAADACAHYILWSSGGAKACDYGRTSVSGGQYVQPATGGYALVLLGRIMRRLAERQTTLTWLCYRAWRLQGEYRTPTMRELAKAHNMRAAEGERVSHATIERRMKAIDEALVQELIKTGMWQAHRVGEERA